MATKQIHLTKEEALKQLAYRKEHQPKHVDNASLYAGSPMYYYCRSCGWESDVLPECHVSAPRRLCEACQNLKDQNWMD